MKLISTILITLAGLTLTLHGLTSNRQKWASDINGKYPELEKYLTAETDYTNEGTPVAAHTFSHNLFNKQHPEFDRTLMSLWSLQLLLDGSDRAYDLFTHDSPDALPREDFKWVVHKFNELEHSGIYELTPQQIRDALYVSLVLGDIGKSHRLQEEYEEKGLHEGDHDDLLAILLPYLKEHPGKSASFDTLHPNAQQLVIEASTLIHWGHASHTEGGPEVYSKLRNFITEHKNQEAMWVTQFSLLHYICDVAGAQGHTTPSHPSTYTQNTNDVLRTLWNSTVPLYMGQKESDVFKGYLTERAKPLGFDIENEDERIMTRLACLMRINSEDIAIAEAYANLAEEHKALAKKFYGEMEAHPKGPTPTYIPAVLLNTKDTHSAISEAFPFVLTVLRDNQYFTTRLNFNPVAGAVRDKGVIALRNSKSSIDPHTGKVVLH